MKTLPIEEAQDLKLSEVLKLVSDGDVVIVTEGGEGRYVIGVVDELEWEAFSLSRNPEFMAYLDACRERGDREGSIPLDEARRRLEDW